MPRTGRARDDSHIFEPTAKGLDINVASHHRGGPYGRGTYFHPFDMPNLESKEGDHLPARLAEETVRFIATESTAPKFAMLSFYSVHTPLVGRPELVEKYRDEEAPTRVGERVGPGRFAQRARGSGARGLRGDGRGDG